MSSTRPLVLAVLTLALWTATRVVPAEEATRIGPGDMARIGPSMPVPASWPTENGVSNIVVKPSLDDEWLLDFDYAYVGKPFAIIRVELIPKPHFTPAADFNGVQLRMLPLTAGRHHVSTVLQYPGDSTTAQVVVSMVTDAPPEYPVLASARIDKEILWPAKDTQDFRAAVDAINAGNREQLREARRILERLVTQNPRFAPAYVELARVAMKSNWGPEGLHQAETLLDSALKVDPTSANAKILLGYVYTHQERYREAEPLFVDAERSNPINTWLWSNWGELLERQGKNDQAIAKYREALARPVKSTQYADSRDSAYAALAKLFLERKDLDGSERMYAARVAEFGPGSCYSLDYAKFKLYVRGDAPGAIELARGALKQNCDDAPSREILGLASYVQWARGTSPANMDALNQARIFLPAGSRTLYLLADNESTMAAVTKLVGSGEAIDQKDDEKMTALAHALQEHKPETAERLLRAGAKPDTPVGYQEMPAALLPVMSRDLDAIRVLQRAGVDYSKLRYRDSTALDYAKQVGDEELLRVLKHKERAL